MAFTANAACNKDGCSLPGVHSLTNLFVDDEPGGSTIGVAIAAIFLDDWLSCRPEGICCRDDILTIALGSSAGWPHPHPTPPLRTVQQLPSPKVEFRFSNTNSSSRRCGRHPPSRSQEGAHSMKVQIVRGFAARWHAAVRRGAGGARSRVNRCPPPQLASSRNQLVKSVSSEAVSYSTRF